MARDALYLFVDARRGLIVPAHGFADAARYRRCGERLHEFWRAGRN
jgi:hypothetical protein